MPSAELSVDEVDDINWAARVGETEELKQLLVALAHRGGTSPAQILSAARDSSGATCLHKAAANGHLDTLRAILTLFDGRDGPERFEFLNLANEFGNTGVHWAALAGHLDVIRLLVEEGAEPARANSHGDLPLDVASRGGHQDVVDFFLAKIGDEDRDDGKLADMAKGEDEEEEEGAVTI